MKRTLNRSNGISRRKRIRNVVIRKTERVNEPQIILERIEIKDFDHSNKIV